MYISDDDMFNMNLEFAVSQRYIIAHLLYDWECVLITGRMLYDTYVFLLDFVDLIIYRFVTMEKKPEQPKPRSHDARSTDVTRDRILSAFFVMSETTTRWKGPRYLAYDTYDAMLRSFFTWPKRMILSPHL
jgi:hypothetical protein